MSRKIDKAKLAAGAAEIRKAQKEKVKPATDIELHSGEQSGSAVKRSWRDCKKVHPVSAEFPRMQPDRLQELALDIEKRGGLLHPVLTCTRREDRQLYIYDGANRLDAWGRLGWQLVDSKGEWCGRILSYIEFRGTK